MQFRAKPKRFGAPIFLDWKDDQLQNVTEPTTCIQVDVTQLDAPPGDPPPGWGKYLRRKLSVSGTYVPAKAFREEVPPLPVVAYIYGGGYIMDSKNQWKRLYTDQTLSNRTAGR